MIVERTVYCLSGPLRYVGLSTRCACYSSSDCGIAENRSRYRSRQSVSRPVEWMVPLGVMENDLPITEAIQFNSIQASFHVKDTKNIKQ